MRIRLVAILGFALSACTTHPVPDEITGNPVSFCNVGTDIPRYIGQRIQTDVVVVGDSHGSYASHLECKTPVMDLRTSSPASHNRRVRQFDELLWQSMRKFNLDHEYAILATVVADVVVDEKKHIALDLKNVVKMKIIELPKDWNKGMLSSEPTNQMAP